MIAEGSGVSLGLRSRVTIVVGGAVATIAGMVLIIAPLIGDLRRETNYSGTIIAQAEQDVAALEAAAIDQETGERGFLLTGRREFLTPYEAGRAEAARRIAALRRIEGVEGLQQALTRVEAALEAWQVGAVEPEITARASGANPGALVLEGEGRRLFQEVRRSLLDLEGTVRGEAQRARDRIDETLRELVGALIVVYGFGAAACLLVWLLLRRWITAPVEALLREVERVSEGDLDHPISVGGPAELAAVASATETMRREIVERLQEANRAREALEQRAPAVVALRAELEPPRPDLPPGIEVVTRFDPVEGVLAGDFSDVLPLGDGRVAVVVADASGHGATVVVRALRAKHLLGAALGLGLGPAAAFERVAPQIGDGEGWFVSAMAIVADRNGTITWAGAGHPAALLRTADGDVVELQSTGPVLGPVPGPWTERTERFPVPWLALLVTDGVLEARNGAREFYGEEPLRDRLASLDPAAPAAPADLLDHIVDALRAHLGGERATDDVTMSVVRVGVHADVIALERPSEEQPADLLAEADLEPDDLARLGAGDPPPVGAAVDDQ